MRTHRWTALGVSALAACGRIGFAPQPSELDGGIDARAPCLPLTEITTPTGDVQMPSLAVTPTVQAVMWMDQQQNGYLGAFVTMIDPDGSTRTTVLAADHETPAATRPWLSGVAASPDVFGVSWFEYTATVRASLYFATVGYDAVVRSGPTQVTTAVAGNPTVIWTGTAFALVYAINRDNPPTGSSPSYVDIQFFDENGVAMGPSSRLTESVAVADYPAVVWTGDGFVIAWRDGRASGSNVFLTTADASGAKTSPDRMLGGTYNFPYLAWNGSEALLVHQGTDTMNPTVFLERFDATGASLGSSSLPLAMYNLAATWNHDHWVVIGQTNGAYPRRFALAPDLTPLGAPVEIWSHYSGFGSRIAALPDRLVISEINNDAYPTTIGVLQICTP